MRPSDIQAWVKRLLVEHQLAPSTVAVVHGVLASMFKTAVRDGSSTRPPARGPGCPRTTGSRGASGRRAGARPEGRHAGALACDGAARRPSPRCASTASSWCARASRRTWGRRSARRPGDVPVPRVLVEALAEHLSAFPPAPREMVCRDEAGRTWAEVVALVFTTARGEPLTRSRFGEAWRDAVQEACLPAGASYHDLRPPRRGGLRARPLL